jgi:hypothetical protein
VKAKKKKPKLETSLQKINRYVRKYTNWLTFNKAIGIILDTHQLQALLISCILVGIKQKVFDQEKLFYMIEDTIEANMEDLGIEKVKRKEKSTPVIKDSK